MTTNLQPAEHSRSASDACDLETNARIGQANDVRGRLVGNELKDVLICAPGADIGDVGSMGKFLKQVANALEERGCRPIVLGAKEFKAARRNDAMLRLFDLLHLPWLFVYWAYAFKVWNEAGRPVITAISQEYVVPFGFDVQIPIYHDLIQYFFPRNGKSAFFYRFYLPWVTRRLGFVYCVTRATGRMVARIMGKVTYRVCGVPIDKHFSVSTKESDARRYRFVWVGTLAKHKDYAKVLDYATHATDTEGSLAMIVPHDDVDVLNAEIATRGLAERVQVLSRLGEDALTQVYKGSDFVLSTAKLEGFCMPVLEAALCGCRPIVPNRAVFRENFERFASFMPPHGKSRDVHLHDMRSTWAGDRIAVAAQARRLYDTVRDEMDKAMDDITRAVATRRKSALFCERD